MFADSEHSTGWQKGGKLWHNLLNHILRHPPPEPTVERRDLGDGLDERPQLAVLLAVCPSRVALAAKLVGPYAGRLECPADCEAC